MDDTLYCILLYIFSLITKYTERAIDLTCTLWMTCRDQDTLGADIFYTELTFIVLTQQCHLKCMHDVWGAIIKSHFGIIKIIIILLLFAEQYTSVLLVKKIICLAVIVNNRIS